MLCLTSLFAVLRELEAPKTMFREVVLTQIQSAHSKPRLKNEDKALSTELRSFAVC